MKQYTLMWVVSFNLLHEKFQHLLKFANYLSLQLDSLTLTLKQGDVAGSELGLVPWMKCGCLPVHISDMKKLTKLCVRESPPEMMGGLLWILFDPMIAVQHAAKKKVTTPIDLDNRVAVPSDFGDSLEKVLCFQFDICLLLFEIRSGWSFLVIME